MEIRAFGSESDVLLKLNGLLQLTLIYAETLQHCVDQSLFKLLNGTDLRLWDGVCRFRCRIDDVSKNHMRRKFAMKFELTKRTRGGCSMPVFSKPVLVLSRIPRSIVGSTMKSKANSRKRKLVASVKTNSKNRKKPDFQVSVVKKPRSRESSLYLEEEDRQILWSRAVFQQLSVMEWSPLPVKQSGSFSFEPSMYYCVACGALSKYKKGVHKPACALRRLIESFPQCGFSSGQRIDELMSHASSTQEDDELKNYLNLADDPGNEFTVVTAPISRLAVQPQSRSAATNTTTTTLTTNDAPVTVKEEPIEEAVVLANWGTTIDFVDVTEEVS
jgi:hypothetical protein